MILCPLLTMRNWSSEKLSNCLVTQLILAKPGRKDVSSEWHCWLLISTRLVNRTPKSLSVLSSFHYWKTLGGSEPLQAPGEVVYVQPVSSALEPLTSAGFSSRKGQRQVGTIQGQWPMGRVKVGELHPVPTGNQKHKAEGPEGNHVSMCSPFCFPF